MKISQLIKQLQAIQAKKGDIDCYLQTDQEGNGYEEIRGASFAYYGYDDGGWGEGCMYNTIKEAIENDQKRKELTDVVIVWP